MELTVGSITDKDRDGNQDTATKPDKLLIRHQVCTHFRERPQTVQLTITIDRPGEEFDEQVTATGNLVTAFCHQQFIEDKVKNKWPSGAYTVTIDAANEFGDTACHQRSESGPHDGVDHDAPADRRRRTHDRPRALRPAGRYVERHRGSQAAGGMATPQRGHHDSLVSPTRRRLGQVSTPA